MASQRLRSAVSAALLSSMSVAYVSYQKGKTQLEDGENSPMLTKEQEKSLVTSYTADAKSDHDGFVRTAERIMQETKRELSFLRGQIKVSSDMAFHDTRVRAMVAARFADIIGRSAFALADYKLNTVLRGDTDKEAMAAVHARAAKSMHDACEEHGGLLVKLGQYMATNMGGFIPEEYIEALRPLQDSCAPLSIEQVNQVISEELNKIQSSSHLENPFVEIDPEPLGSASLAQVHTATLADGSRVAIKVQRPNLDKTTKADLVALKVLSLAVDRAFPGTSFDWMLPEFHSSIAAELDFTQEALNAKRCQKMLWGCPLETRGLWQRSRTTAATAIVPTPIDDLTTTRMLTMTFEEGFKITNKEQLQKHGIDPRRVAASTCALFAELIHVHGFVHTDPHPGNILVRPRLSLSGKQKGEFDLILLDHGMYRRLDESFRGSYCHLWAGLVSGNGNQALNGVRGLGLPDTYLDIMGLMLTYRIPSNMLTSDSVLSKYKLGTIAGKAARKELKKHFQEKYGDDMLSPSGMNKFMESQPRDLLFCLRCMNLVRGINRELGGTTLDRFIAFGTAASRGSRMISAPSNHCDVTRDEAGTLTSSSSDDVLTQAKRSLNQPVLSEVVSKTRDGRVMIPFTTADYIDACKISVRTWWRGFLLDLLVLFSGTPMTVSSRRLG